MPPECCTIQVWRCKAVRDLTLAEKLKRLRGLEPQFKAAERAGIPPATLCQLENEKRGTSTRRDAVAKRQATLMKLATAYGVAVEYLTGDLPNYMMVFAKTYFAQPGQTAGARLKLLVLELQIRYGIEPEELAKALGISSSIDLRAYQEDRLRFSSSVFGRLEQLVGIPSDWLLRGSEPTATDLAARYKQGLLLAAAGGLSPERLEELVRECLNRSVEK